MEGMSHWVTLEKLGRRPGNYAKRLCRYAILMSSRENWVSTSKTNKLNPLRFTKKTKHTRIRKIDWLKNNWWLGDVCVEKFHMCFTYYSFPFPSVPFLYSSLGISLQALLEIDHWPRWSINLKLFYTPNNSSHHKTILSLCFSSSHESYPLIQDNTSPMAMFP